MVLVTTGNPTLPGKAAGCRGLAFLPALDDEVQNTDDDQDDDDFLRSYAH